jgi:putative NIF3 family GTP cyclohydrolase 1 type 2
MHAHQPDGIFTGVVKYLGWSDTLVTQRSESMYSHFHVRFPEMTVEELCQHFIRTLNLNGMRYIGDPAAKVSTLAFVGHLFPTPPRPGSDGSRQVEYGASIIRTLEEQADVIVPGEIIEWTVLSYVRDAVELGKAKAVLNPGHFNWEELGMKYAQEWISALVDGAVPVTYVPSGDLYRFALPRK